MLEGLRFLFSQQRGVVDFICRQLAGDGDVAIGRRDGHRPNSALEADDQQSEAEPQDDEDHGKPVLETLRDAGQEDDGDHAESQAEQPPATGAQGPIPVSGPRRGMRGDQRFGGLSQSGLVGEQKRPVSVRSGRDELRKISPLSESQAGDLLDKVVENFPEAVASLSGKPPQQRLLHEFHALSGQTGSVHGGMENQVRWRPQGVY